MAFEKLNNLALIDMNVAVAVMVHLRNKPRGGERPHRTVVSRRHDRQKTGWTASVPGPMWLANRSSLRALQMYAMHAAAKPRDGLPSGLH